MFLAASEGDVATVQSLIDRGAPVDVADECWDAALFTAVKFQHTDVMELLLRHGVDPNGWTSGSTPLMEAAVQRNPATMRILLEAGADPARAAKTGGTALRFLLLPMGQVLETDLMDMASLLLAHGADPGDGLASAAAQNLPRLTALLLDAGADPNHTDARGDSPLLRAVENGHFEMAHFLLQRGARVDAPSEPRPRFHPEAAAFMAAKGYFNPGPLHRAAGIGELGKVARLLAEGSAVDDTDGNGMTALMHALHGNHAEVVHTLLAAGASRTVTDAAGWMPVHHAARFADESLFTAVLPDGFDAHSTPQDPRPALSLLSLAARNGDVGIVRRLLAAGAEIDEENFFGEQPLHAAAAKGSLPVVRELVASGAETNRYTGWGTSPLQLAAENGHMDVARYLVASGADILQNSAGPVRHVFFRAVLGNNRPLMNAGCASGTISTPLPRKVSTRSRLPARGPCPPWRRWTFCSAEDADGFTVTHYVAASPIWKYNHQRLGMLLRRGGDAARQDRHGLSPIHYAAARRNFRAMRLLLDETAGRDRSEEYSGAERKARRRHDRAK